MSQILKDWKSPSLPVMKLDENEEVNKTHPLPMLNYDALYLILGEVGNIKHYIIMEYYPKTQILPGIFELYRFRYATEDEY